MPSTAPIIHFPDAVMGALIDAVVNVFWLKREMRDLFSRCQIPTDLITSQDWDLAKFKVADPILKRMNVTEAGLGPLRAVLAETLSHKDGSHLLWMSDGKERKEAADRCLARLRDLVGSHDMTVEKEKEEQRKRREALEKARASSAFFTKLDALKARFLELHTATDAKKRGYDFQDLLYDLFALCDLKPRSPFANKGEQIDGAFIHDSTDFLLEAKWQQTRVILSDLRDLDGAVGSKLDNTLGLFIAVSGFSPDALDAYRRQGRPKLICMDGTDLMCVLAAQVDLGDLLRRKRDVAAQRGDVFVRAADILAAKHG